MHFFVVSWVPKFEFSVSTNRFLAQYSEEKNGNGNEGDYDDVLWENFGSYESTGRVYFYVVHNPKASSDVRKVLDHEMDMEKRRRKKNPH